MTGGESTAPRRPRFGAFRLIVAMLRRPRRTLEELAGDPRALRHGLTLMLGLAIAYTAVDVFLALGDVHPIPEPFLRIPSDEYYTWSAPFYGVTFFGGWLLSTAVMQLLARAAGGTGQFEQLAGATGTATAVASLPTLVPDFITSALGVYDQWAATGPLRIVPFLYMGMYVVLFLVYYPLALKAVHRSSTGRAVAIGMGGYIVYQAYLFVFIR